MITTDGLLAAAYSPTDGHCTPESVVNGYAGAARAAGARIVRNCAVTAIDSSGGAITRVVTDRGTIATDTVVCAAGAWSRGLGAMVGVDLPVEPLRRQILTTAPMPGLDPHTPFTIDFTTSFYFHGEGEGLLLGMSDPHETPGFRLTESDGWLAGLGEAIERRAPAISDVGLCAGWAGLYEMTPDHNALVGEAEGVSRFLYATGFSGHGFLMGPAIGEVMRDLYLGRPPVVDVSPLTANRLRRLRAPARAQHRLTVPPTSRQREPHHPLGETMTGTMRQIPDSAALNQLALATASRCGVDVDAVAGDVVNTSPINGEPLAAAQLGHRPHRRRQRHPGTGGFPAVARGSSPCPGRTGQAAWASCSPYTRTTSPP